VNYINLNDVRFRGNGASFGEDIYVYDSNGFQENSTSAIVNCVSTLSYSVFIYSSSKNLSSSTVSSSSNLFDWVRLKKKKKKRNKNGNHISYYYYFLFISDSRYER
jgi:hypothetical protein